MGACWADARISDCGRYRWWLARRWVPSAEPARIALFVMLNPSTANALVDDPTIRRCRAFARDLGCGVLEVVNLYGLRSTDPAQLLLDPDPVGPMNDAAIAWAASRADVVIAAWGTFAGRSQAREARVDTVRALLPDELVCLGRTRDGHPRHPLYLPASSVVEPFDERARRAVGPRAISPAGPVASVPRAGPPTASLAPAGPSRAGGRGG